MVSNITLSFIIVVAGKNSHKLIVTKEKTFVNRKSDKADTRYRHFPYGKKKVRKWKKK